MYTIAAHKKAEDALRFSEARYRALFRDNPTMIFTLDADLTILAVNPFGARQLGYTINELEGQSMLVLFHDDDHPAVIEQLRNCLCTPEQVYRWQFRKIRKDGELVWVEETAQAVYDLTGSINILIVCQDISDRKRAEEERERLLIQLEAVLENINEGVVIADLNGNVVAMNKSALALHELQSVEQARRPLSEYQGTFELFGLDGVPVPFAEWPMNRALQHERFVEYEVRILCKETGKSRFVSYSGTPVYGGTGDVILSVITMRDITERKSAEEEIRKLNVSLTARAADLEVVNRELEAFNYSVAHDLRQPLNVISNCCQVIKELCGSKFDEQCRHYHEEAFESTRRMSRLIEALLDFSRMGHVEPCREQVDLGAVAHEVADMLKLAGPERQVDFRIAGHITATADASLLRIVLDNLFGNAWKYTAAQETAVIEFGVTIVDGTPVYFVRDNGTGFDPAEAGRLFVPFQRLSGAEEFRGFGIGLATVERIIRRHGGRIWAAGKPGRGATFSFTLSSAGGGC